MAVIIALSLSSCVSSFIGDYTSDSVQLCLLQKQHVFGNSSIVYEPVQFMRFTIQCGCQGLMRPRNVVDSSGTLNLNPINYMNVIHNILW